MEIFSVCCVNTDVHLDSAGLSFSSFNNATDSLRLKCRLRMSESEIAKYRWGCFVCSDTQMALCGFFFCFFWRWEVLSDVSSLSLCLQLSGGCELTVVLTDFTAGCSTEMSVSTGERNLCPLYTVFILCSFVVFFTVRLCEGSPL